ncbi:hypothetical protein LBMAG53_21700 [Planctomycetota bacterium]|nr:hypothetical protein LBMAG53_21700 [Planctomycetota bacterium]
MMNEINRLSDVGRRGPPDGPCFTIIARCVNGSETLHRVKDVLNMISQADADRLWPSDDDWARRLPLWFTEPFHGRTIQDVLKDDMLWDFGSWLDAMRHRGWEWWDGYCDDDLFMATLTCNDQVYSVDPLIYLVRQSGATSIKVIEK